MEECILIEKERAEMFIALAGALNEIELKLETLSIIWDRMVASKWKKEKNDISLIISRTLGMIELGHARCMRLRLVLEGLFRSCEETKIDALTNKVIEHDVFKFFSILNHIISNIKGIKANHSFSYAAYGISDPLDKNSDLCYKQLSETLDLIMNAEVEEVDKAKCEF